MGWIPIKITLNRAITHTPGTSPHWPVAALIGHFCQNVCCHWGRFMRHSQKRVYCMTGIANKKKKKNTSKIINSNTLPWNAVLFVCCGHFYVACCWSSPPASLIWCNLFNSGKLPHRPYCTSGHYYRTICTICCVGGGEGCRGYCYSRCSLVSLCVALTHWSAMMLKASVISHCDKWLHI